jgi:hypothetical protein
MINVISLGAGKQSSYMLLNALEGRFKFYPDYAIFSDTGCEPKYVYEFLDWLTVYVKEKYNFEIVRVSAGNLWTDTLDFLEGRRKRTSTLPLRIGDSGGLLMRQCTLDYKIRPLRQYIQKHRYGHNVRLWIGISLDEIERMKDSTVKYIQNYYPLIEERIAIDQIVAWFEFNKIREPGKSACLMCPFHSFAYWSALKRYSMNEFIKACDFDDKIRDYPKVRGKAYLSNLRKPLREIDFSQHPSLFPDLIEECEGLCGL